MYSKLTQPSEWRRPPILSVDAHDPPVAGAPAPRVLIKAAGRFCPDAPARVRELAEIQRRLGTRHEQPGDLDRVNALARQLSNLLYAAFMMEDFEQEGGLAEDLDGI
jgi:hypothetical protein